MRKAPFVLMAVLLLGASAPSRARASVFLNWRLMAQRVVAQLALRPGEKVLLITQPGRFAPLAGALRAAVRNADGIDLGEIDVSAGGMSRQELREKIREADAILKLPGATPEHLAYRVAQALLGVGQARAVHFHWEGAFPVPGYPAPDRDTIDATYQQALLETDYAQVAAAQQRFEEALRRGEVRVTTALGTDLRFRVGDRPVTRQDGDASQARALKAAVIIDREVELPCGAVRVAPLEDTVNGVIVFPPSEWAGVRVENARLYFRRGRIVRVEAASGKEHVVKELEQASERDPDKEEEELATWEDIELFREFALGFNPELEVPDRQPWIPYYGYGSGVVRLSLGDNTELGGRVRAPYVRWNFFPRATVTVAGDVWVRDGRLTGR